LSKFVCSPTFGKILWVCFGAFQLSAKFGCTAGRGHENSAKFGKVRAVWIDPELLNPNCNEKVVKTTKFIKCPIFRSKADTSV